MHLQLQNLSIKLKTENKQILDSVNLSISSGEIHLLMGPNGAGKSSLAKAIMSHPELENSGKILLDKEDITSLEVDQKAKKGLFLGHQHPVEVPKVRLTWFIRNAVNSTRSEDNKISTLEFLDDFKKYTHELGLDEKFIDRNLNEGFSGGEKKKSEILQMLLIKPKFAILDEIDSGLDLEALKDIFKAIQNFVKENNSGVLIITHNPKILDYIKPDFVHLMKGGKILESGDWKLAERIVAKGYGT